MQSLLFNQRLLPQPPHFPRVSRLLAAFTSPFPAWGPEAGREGTVPTALGGTWAAGTPAVTLVSPRFGVATAPLPGPAAEASPGAGSVPGLAELRPEAAAPNPGWYLRRSLGSIKREKLSPELISVPWFNPGARLPVISPGAEFSAGERRGPVPVPRPP